MRLSEQGVKFIAQFEGFRAKLYNDVAGHCTIGFGHLVHKGKINGSEPAEFKRGITLSRGYELLRSDAEVMEKAVNGLGIPLNQNQFDALVSFTFNIGPGWMSQKSKLIDALRAHRYGDVPSAMNLWNKAGSPPRPVAGLTRRREAEGSLFARGQDSSQNGKPGVQVVRVADVQPGEKNEQILIVQKALQKAVGLDFSSAPGTFGPATTKAYAAWQRKCGFTGADTDGKPGLKTLKLLGDKYGFAVRAP